MGGHPGLYEVLCPKEERSTEIGSIIFSKKYVRVPLENAWIHEGVHGDNNELKARTKPTE